VAAGEGLAACLLDQRGQSDCLGSSQQGWRIVADSSLRYRPAPLLRDFVEQHLVGGKPREVLGVHQHVTPG
jgi:hypothetical protein